MYVLYDAVEREAARQTNPTVDINLVGTGRLFSRVEVVHCLYFKCTSILVRIVSSKTYAMTLHKLYVHTVNLLRYGFRATG
jgi:hypothetical protein